VVGAAANGLEQAAVEDPAGAYHSPSLTSAVVAEANLPSQAVEDTRREVHTPVVVVAFRHILAVGDNYCEVASCHNPEAVHTRPFLAAEGTGQGGGSYPGKVAGA